MPVLPVGLTAEPSSIVTLLRVVALLWAAALLLAGRRLARTTVGTLLLLLGAAIGWGALASTSYLLAIVVAVAVLAAGIAAFEVAPRVAMALAMAWPLPALYVGAVMLQGDFPRRRWLMLVLLVLGVVLGAALPEPSVGIVASALATVLVALAWPGEPRPWLLAVFAAGVAWNLLGLRRPLALRGRFPEPAGGRRDVRTPVRRALVAGAGGLLGLLVLAALAAPAAAGGRRRAGGAPGGGARARRPVPAGVRHRRGELLLPVRPPAAGRARRPRRRRDAAPRRARGRAPRRAGRSRRRGR